MLAKCNRFRSVHGGYERARIVGVGWMMKGLRITAVQVDMYLALADISNDH